MILSPHAHALMHVASTHSLCRFPSDVTFTDTLVVTLSVVDLVRILAEPTLGRTVDTTYLSLDAGSLNTITGQTIVGTDGMKVG